MVLVCMTRSSTPEAVSSRCSIYAIVAIVRRPPAAHSMPTASFLTAPSKSWTARTSSPSFPLARPDQVVPSIAISAVSAPVLYSSSQRPNQRLWSSSPAHWTASTISCRCKNVGSSTDEVGCGKLTTPKALKGADPLPAVDPPPINSQDPLCPWQPGLPRPQLLHLRFRELLLPPRSSPLPLPQSWSLPTP